MTERLCLSSVWVWLYARSASPFVELEGIVSPPRSSPQGIMKGKLKRDGKFPAWLDHCDDAKVPEVPE